MEAKETIGTVICSSCNIPMIVTARHQILFSGGLVQVMYRCDHCGAETTATRGTSPVVCPSKRAWTARKFGVAVGSSQRGLGSTRATGKCAAGSTRLRVVR